MLGPRSRTCQVRAGVGNSSSLILPPAACFQEVHLPIAIHIANAEAVGELRHLHILRHRHKGPFLGRLLPVRCEPAKLAPGAAHDLRFAIACDVGEDGRFVVHHISDDVHGPGLVVMGAGVQVHARLFAGETEDEDVVLLVRVEVLDVGEEVVRVAIDAENLWLVVGVLLFKRGPLPPERTGDDVWLAIAIDVTDGGAFGIKLAVQLLALPGDLGLRMELGGGEEKEKQAFHDWVNSNASRNPQQRTSFMSNRPCRCLSCAHAARRHPE